MSSGGPIPRRRPRLLGLGAASLALGFLGLFFFWWVPFGVILSGAGLLLGLFGWWLSVARRGPGPSLAVAGTLLSAVALVIGLVLASGGLVRGLGSGGP
jgi:hypothetical protein